MQKGKFIVLEGIDKSGTTTQTKLLTSYLIEKSKSNSIFSTREPTMDSLEGKMLREVIFKSNTDPYADRNLITYLFLKDRIYHTKIIKKHLEQGYHVVSDRYKYSTMAYQAAQGCDLEGLIDIQKDFLVPDLVLFLRLYVEDALKRPETDQHKETFDKANIEFHKKLDANYLAIYYKLMDEEPIFLIDASKPIEAVFEDIKKEVNKIL